MAKKKAKKSTVDIIKRWVAMDFDLANRNLVIKAFAREWRVDERTVRRDLAALDELGHEYEWFRRGGENGKGAYGYDENVDPLFADRTRLPEGKPGRPWS